VNKIIVAHSPDADDIFMYYAIKFGWVNLKNTRFDNLALDIETLNKATLKGEYDICAISFALYPFIKNEFALLKTAISFGDGYGPKLVKLNNNKLKRNFKVALSGKYTTNALLFKIKYPEARITYMNFLEIEQAVLDGVVASAPNIQDKIVTGSARITHLYFLPCTLKYSFTTFNPSLDNSLLLRTYSCCVNG
jgi:1,4-dihydroxy-6-naphthoate synthase